MDHNRSDEERKMENVLILVAYSILICDSRADFQCCLSVECGAFFSINIEKYHYLEQFRSPSPYKNPDWVKSINQNLSGLNCVMAITLVRLYKISILAFFFAWLTWLLCLNRTGTERILGTESVIWGNGEEVILHSKSGACASYGDPWREAG